MSDTMEGGCACGRVRYRARIDSDDAYLCHCRMCQRATGSVSIAFKLIEAEAMEWLSAPDWFESSPIARRPYCAACGTSLGFQYREGPNLDLTVASFDNASRFSPKSHFGAESMHRAWVDTAGLPEQRSDEHDELQQRWARAGASPPE